MQSCPDSRCRFKTNKPSGLDHHLKANPHHQTGYNFGEFKGHKKTSGKKGDKAVAKK
ncbi:hypothetical protein HY631_02080 [Candidatus Uhrbacteria bacterium]|nr:hypothetical protein [Candidatus Uhrbacteria bacterium]